MFVNHGIKHNSFEIFISFSLSYSLYHFIISHNLFPVIQGWLMASKAVSRLLVSDTMYPVVKALNLAWIELTLYKTEVWNPFGFVT